MKTVFNIVLVLCAAALIYICYTSIMGPINFENAKKEREKAVKVAQKKFNELGEKTNKEELEVLKIKRKGEYYYYISAKDNTVEVRIKDNKITRINSVPIEEQK